MSFMKKSKSNSVKKPNLKQKSNSKSKSPNMDLDPEAWLYEDLETVNAELFPQNQAANLVQETEETRDCRWEAVQAHAPDVKCIGQLVVKFLKKSDGKKKIFYATASLINKIGGDGNENFLIITSAHNFIQAEIGPNGEEENLEYQDAMFVLQRNGVKECQAHFKVTDFENYPKYKNHQDSCMEGFDIAVADVKLLKLISGTLEEIYEQVTPICEIDVKNNDAFGIQENCADIFIGGYPKDVLSGKDKGHMTNALNQLYSIQGPIEKIILSEGDQEGHGIAIHSLDTSAGQSGSALQRKQADNSYEIFGVHMGAALISTKEIPSEHYYIGALITTQVYEWIQSMIKLLENGKPIWYKVPEPKPEKRKSQQITKNQIELHKVVEENKKIEKVKEFSKTVNQISQPTLEEKANKIPTMGSAVIAAPAKVVQVEEQKVNFNSQILPKTIRSISDNNVIVKNDGTYNCEKNVKLIIIGELNVGKSSLIQAYTTNSVTPGQFEKQIVIDQTLVHTTIWDTAGEEKFKSIQQSFYRGADCCVLCFDICKEETFNEIKQWKQIVLDQATPKDQENFPFILVGTKKDMASMRQVSAIYQAVVSWCQLNNNIKYFETSTQNKLNIDFTFQHIIKQGLNYQNRLELQKTKSELIYEEKMRSQNHSRTVSLSHLDPRNYSDKNNYKVEKKKCGC